MHKNLLDSHKRLHFVGIGGSGMCPMAGILFAKGYSITGSDLYESETLARVRASGIPVTVGHAAENIGDAEIVVYTAAATSDNPELVEAKRRGLPVVERSVMLGMMAAQYKKPICVSGTHGKTTTTAMLTQIMIECQTDPSAIIGGRLPLIDGNCVAGESDFLLCEACEYVDTFLQLSPYISVITNIDADHLDYFKTLDNIIHSFRRFADQTSALVIVNGDNLNAMKSVAGYSKSKLITFGIQPCNDYYAADLNEEDTTCEDFTLMYQGKALGRVNLTVPGEHNMYNALAAAAAAHTVGCSPDGICAALAHFSGVHRRFEILGIFEGITIADDFAHHPTELEAVLNSAMKMGYKNVWTIFQPHTYSRTYNHFDDFVKVLSIPDHLIMTEILAVRETNKYHIKTADLAEKLPGSLWFEHNDDIVRYVTGKAAPGDLILTIGGGDIYKCANQIVAHYTNQT